MKPPIEYRPTLRAKTKQFGVVRHLKPLPAAKAAALSSEADFIVIRRDRAKYNAYMRAYRKRKKAET